MAYSICDNIAVHGPFNQHLFLGCSVENISLSLGMNDQQSELSVNLIEDCATVPEGGNPKLFTDFFLSLQSTYNADPGFINPNVGSPVYFRLGQFEFAGLLQAWTKKESADGRPKYSVRVVDPRQILEGTQIIIGNYSGGVGSVYNLINVFGFMERFGATAVCVPQPFEPTCSDTFGNALGFGGADINGEGMSWNRIRVGLQVLLGSFPKITNIYSPYGRMIFKGSKFGNIGFGTMAADAYDINLYANFGGAIEQGSAYHDGYISEYVLDITELPAMPDDFRISGDTISILELISRVCDASSHDYYIELVPVQSGFGIVKVIKVRTISRGVQPALQTLDTYVNANQTIDFSIGHELRNETTTVFISGAKKESFYEVNVGAWDEMNEEHPDMEGPEDDCLNEGLDGEGDEYHERDWILPFLAFDSNNNAILPTKSTGASKQWIWDGIDVRGLKLILEGDVGVEDSISIRENEILAALGSYDSWLSFATALDSELLDLCDPNGLETKAVRANVMNLWVQANKPKQALPHDAFRMVLAGPGAADADAEARKAVRRNLDKAYKFISNLAQNYGNKFMVRAPYSCVRRDNSTGEFIFSETPTSSAWTDDTDIMGLPNPSNFLDLFSTEDGKIECIIKYSERADKLQIDGLSPDSFGKVNNDLYLKASVEEGYVFTDISTLCGPRILVTVNNKVEIKDIDKEFGKLREAAMGAWTLIIQKSNPNADKETINRLISNMGNLFVMPKKGKFIFFDNIVIPMRSNINRYGPWITAGPPGQIRFEINDDLAPWNYGGTPAMCNAAQLLADEGITIQQATELGSITLPGFPVYNGGAEFGSVVGGKNLVENRLYSTDGFSETAVGDTDPTDIDYIYMPSEAGGAWTGQYGPIITDIRVDVGPQGIQSTYSFRTYTTRSGKLNKLNTERIRSIGKTNYKIQKNLNTLDRVKNLLKEKNKRGIKEEGK